MSSIGPDIRVSPLATQVGLDGQPGVRPAGDAGLAHADAVLAFDAAHAFDGQPAAPQVDAGERLLDADAWQSFALGDRLFSGDSALQERLGGLGLSQAADQAADAILDALG